MRKIDVPNLDDLYSLYQRSKSIHEVATIAGVGATTLHRKFKAAGYDCRRSLDPGEAALRSLYVDQGLSSVLIAPMFGVYDATVCDWLKKYGLTRPANEAASLRMARMTAVERMANATAAHDAVRGVPYPFAAACRRALGCERNLSHQSPSERELIAMLDRPVIGQKAIGPYNADIAIGRIAVEVLGGEWLGGSRVVWQKRTRYIIDAGWSVIGVRVKTDGEPLTINAAEYIIAFDETLSWDPSARGQYRVIRGTGEEVIAGCANDDYFPLKPARRGSPTIRCEHDLITG